MKKIILFLILLFFPFSAQAKEVSVYLFYGNECPYCQNEEKFLEIVSKQYGDNVVIHKYEVWHNKENANLMKQVKEKLNVEGDGIPFTVVGTQSNVGYSEKLSAKIKKMIDSNLVNQQADVVSGIKNDKKITDQTTKNEELSFPLVGNIKVKEMPFVFQTLLLALGTVFSLNGLWIILFLAAILLPLKTNKNILNLSFLIGVIITYLFFIFADVKLSNITLMILRTIIAIIPIIIGALVLNKYIKVDTKEIKMNFIQKRQKIFSSLGMLILGLVIGFVLYNYGVPNLLNISLEINDLNTGCYYILYVLWFLIFSFIIVKLLDKVLSKIPNKNIFSFIVLIIISIGLIFFPSLFIFAS